jgi:nucleotide-binding universal stress UspA family protein
MRNPLRSEAEAYRFLLLTIGYFAAIVIASLAGNRWWGLGVFILLTAAGAWWFMRSGDETRPAAMTPRATSPGEHRILVVANETVGAATLRARIEAAVGGKQTQVLVVCPALNSPLRHWASDEDGARAAAQQRLTTSLERLAADGIDARGEVGDGHPLQAIEDALRTFGADEIIISTHPLGRSHWLEQGLVDHARERFPVQITHVVVDLEAEGLGKA